MRAFATGSAVLVLALSSTGVASAASAQQATRNTPEGIVCAMTGSCGDAQADANGRVAVGDERAFSLARPNATSTERAPTRATPTATRRTASRAPARRAVAAAPTVRPGGGIDMQVSFKLGSAEMTPQARAEARAFAQAMAAPQMANMRFAIEGHTDSSGMRDRNLELSQKRAEAVADYLAAQGVDRSRLTTKGYGPDRPIRGLPASAGANRRVEFVKAA